MTITQGWAIPDLAPVAHFFQAGESLCRQWRYSGPVHADGHPSVNCRRCSLLRASGSSTAGGDVSKVSA